MKKNGFTIVELVIVIAVIAVLAAVMIPTFSGIIEKANISSDIQLVRNINTILKTESIGTKPPSTIDEFKTLLDKNGISEDDIKTPKYTVYWLKEDGVAVLANDTNIAIYPEQYSGEHYNEAKWNYLFGAGYQKIFSYTARTTINGNPPPYTDGSTTLWKGQMYKVGSIKESDIQSFTVTMNGRDVEYRVEDAELPGHFYVIVDNISGNVVVNFTTKP